MASLPNPILTVEEYLDLDRRSERRSEFHDGEMFPIEASTISHGRIQGNMYVALRTRLANTPCEALLSSVRVEIPNVHRYTYPDILISCGQPRFEDEQLDTLLNPVVLIEVLSPSTKGFDRGEKFFLYQTIPSVREYILVTQNHVLVERFRRQNERQWLYELLTSLDAELTIESAGCTIPLREIYAKVDLDPPLE
ncbi:MAG TPA: Uma2 family endonuclease [Bryobacteraceae bacterium]